MQRNELTDEELEDIEKRKKLMGTNPGRRGGAGSAGGMTGTKTGGGPRQPGTFYWSDFPGYDPRNPQAAATSIFDQAYKQGGYNSAVAALRSAQSSMVGEGTTANPYRFAKKQ
jgi:hypothetical protein